MPCVVRYPREVPARSVPRAMALNLDIAPTVLELAGVYRASVVDISDPQNPVAATADFTAFNGQEGELRDLVAYLRGTSQVPLPKE